VRVRTACLAAAAAILLPVAAAAQVDGGALPGRDRFITPAPPRAQPGGPAIVLPSTVPPTDAQKIRVNVRDICIKGATVYSKDQLAPLFAGLIGHDVPVQALYDLAKAITAKYGNDGYVLSRAIVPPQAFAPRGAVPCLQVIEGYVDHVEWPAAVAKYPNFFADYTAKITADRPTNVRTIERYLLLAGDLPGLHFTASLKPSKTNEGASTLVVAVTEKPIDAFGRFDNRGTPQRGPREYLTGASFNNLLRQNEAFTVNWADTVPGTNELKYFAANYRQVLTSEGLYGFINSSYAWGRPDNLKLQQPLDQGGLGGFHTRSLYVEAGLAQPVIRTRERNLTLAGLVYATNNFSDFDEIAFQSLDNRDHIRGLRLKADADWADRWLGINQVNVTYSQGFLCCGSSQNNTGFDIGNNLNPNLLSNIAGRTDFSKVEVTLSRTQPLFGPFSAFGSIYGQYSGEPLLASEQCSYGGRFFGRAYDPSQLLGDQCFEAIVEFRYDVPKWTKSVTQTQFYGFGDYGKLWVLGPPFIDPNTGGISANAVGASAGGGVRLAFWDAVTADLQVAKAVHGIREDTRFFFIVGAKY
jgi:hemolysin activation/secretion protein